MPTNEREGVRHHLMDFLEPDKEYQVTSFLKDASEKVNICEDPQRVLASNQA